MAVKTKQIVPAALMIPIGAEWTKQLKKCADSWSDSEVGVMRSQLPPMYHAVPLDQLRKMWINIRKKGTDGYRVSGKGPAKGSRVNKPRTPPPKWYLDYLNSDHFKALRERILEVWGHRCAVCYEHQDSTTIDIHHRTYHRLHKEIDTDVIPLCRRCHDLFHDSVPISKDKGLF